MQFTGGPGLQQALRLEDWDPPGVLRELQESLDIFPQRHFLGMMGQAVCAFRTLLRSCSLVGISMDCFLGIERNPLEVLQQLAQTLILSRRSAFPAQITLTCNERVSMSVEEDKVSKVAVNGMFWSVPEPQNYSSGTAFPGVKNVYARESRPTKRLLSNTVHDSGVWSKKEKRMADVSSRISRSEWAEQINVDESIFDKIDLISVGENKVIIDDLGIQIRHAQLRTLLPGEWMVDVLVDWGNRYMAKIVTRNNFRDHGQCITLHEHETDSLIVFDCSWFQKVQVQNCGNYHKDEMHSWIKGLDLWRFKRWIFPVCTRGHYLSAIVNIQERIVLIKDSFISSESGQIHTQLFSLVKNVAQHYASICKFNEVTMNIESFNMEVCKHVPRQPDLHSCCPSTMMDIFDSMSGKIPLGQRDYRRFRALLAQVLYQLIPADAKVSRGSSNSVILADSDAVMSEDEVVVVEEDFVAVSEVKSKTDVQEFEAKCLLEETKSGEEILHLKEGLAVGSSSGEVSTEQAPVLQQRGWFPSADSWTECNEMLTVTSKLCEDNEWMQSMKNALQSELSLQHTVQNEYKLTVQIVQNPQAIGRGVFINPIPYARLDGDVELCRESLDHGTLTRRKLSIQGNVHAVQPNGSCGFIMVCNAIEKLSNDPDLSRKVEEIMRYDADFQSGYTKVKDVSKLIWSQPRKERCCMPLRLLVCRTILKNPEKFICYVPQGNPKPFTQTEKKRIKRILGDDYEDSNTTAHSRVQYCAHSHLLEKFWFDELTAEVLCFLLNNKLGLCILNMVSESASYIRKDLNRGVELVLLAAKWDEHFDVIDIGNQSIVFFDQLTLVGKCDEVAFRALGNCSHSSVKVNIQSKIESYFKPKHIDSSTETSVQTTECCLTSDSKAQIQKQVVIVPKEQLNSGCAYCGVQFIFPSPQRYIVVQCKLCRQKFCGQCTVTTFYEKHHNFTCLECTPSPDHEGAMDKIAIYCRSRVEIGKALIQKIGIRTLNPILRQTLVENQMNVDRLGDFIHNLFYSGLHEALTNLMPSVVHILMAQLHLGFKPLLSPSLVRSLLGHHTSISSRTVTLVRSAYVEDNMRALSMFYGPHHVCRRLKVQSLIKVGYFVDFSKMDSLSNLVCGHLQQHDFSRFDPWLISANSCAEPNTPAGDLFKFFESLHKLVLLPADLTSQQMFDQFSSLELDAVIVSEGMYSVMDLVAIRRAALSFFLTTSGELEHGKSGVADFTIGGKSVNEKQRSNQRDKGFIDIVSCLPNPLHHYFNELPDLNRQHFNFPPDDTLFCYPGSLENVTSELIHVWLTLIIRVERSLLVLISWPPAMCHQVKHWIKQFKIDHPEFDERRVLFQPFQVKQSQELWSMLKVVNLILHSSGTCDAVNAGKPVLCIDNENADTETRLSIELMISLGLDMFVTKNTQQFLDVGEQYAKKSNLQTSVELHIKKQKDHGLGFFDKTRWIRCIQEAIEGGLQQVEYAAGDTLQLKDIDLTMLWERPVLEEWHTSLGNSIFDSIPNSSCLPVKLQKAIKGILHDVHENANVLHECIGMGGATIVISGTDTKTAQQFALKIGTESVHKDHLYMSTVFREGLNMVAMRSRIRKSVFPNMLARPVNIFSGKSGKSCFWGHSSPDERSHVYVFLCCTCVEQTMRAEFFTRAEAWKETGIIQDEFRHSFALPLIQAIDFIGSKGFSVLDFKPDNIGQDQEGNIVFIDLGFSMVHESKEGKLGFPSAMQVLNSCASARKITRTIRGQQLSNTTVMSSSDFERFMTNVCREGGAFPCLGIGTKTFYDDTNLGLRKISKRNSGYIREVDCLAEDLYQVVRSLLQIFCKPNGPGWENEACEAAMSTEAMVQFLMKGLNKGTQIQQTIALERLADFFCKSLGPKRISINEVQRHPFLSLLILDPEYEQLALNGGIEVEGGYLRDFNYVTHLNPNWKDYYQVPALIKFEGSKGLGVICDLDVEEGVFLGFYSGPKVNESEFDPTSKNKRYVVTFHGVFRKQCDNKFYCDATPSKKLTFAWFQKFRVWGPFINSADSAEQVNCVVERRKAWLDPQTNILWIPVFSSRRIQKGEWLHWKYNECASRP